MNKFCEKVDACNVNKQARKNRRKNQAVTSLVVKRNEVVKNTVASMFFFAPKMSWGTLLSVERHLLTTTVMAYLILFAIFWHDVTQNFTGFFVEPLNVLVRAPTNVIWNLSSSVIVTVVASFIHFLPLLTKLLIDGSHFIGEQFLDYY